MGRLSPSDPASMPAWWWRRRNGITEEDFIKVLFATPEDPDCIEYIDSRTQTKHLSSRLQRALTWSSVQDEHDDEPQEGDKEPTERSRRRSLTKPALLSHFTQLSPKTPMGPKSSGVWLSGHLWKLNSGDADPSQLQYWRRRYFTLCWRRSLGLVLYYVSEKVGCTQTLGCIIQGKGIDEADVTMTGSIAVSVCETVRQSLVTSTQMYDIAVHKLSLLEVAEVSLPSELTQIVINGVDEHGDPKKLTLGWADSDALIDLLKTIQAAVRHHFHGEVQNRAVS